MQSKDLPELCYIHAYKGSEKMLNSRLLFFMNAVVQAKTVVWFLVVFFLLCDAVKMYFFKNFVKIGKHQMTLCKKGTVNFGNYWHDMSSQLERLNFSYP